MGMRGSRLALAAVSFWLVGCSTEGRDPLTTSEDTSPSLASILSGGMDERSQVPAPLRDTAWLLVSVEGRDAAQDVEGLASRLVFAADRVSGKTCNSYTADVDAATPERITTGGFVSTRIGCGGPAAQIDRLVQELLQSGAGWHRQEGVLTLSRGAVTLTFALQRA